MKVQNQASTAIASVLVSLCLACSGGAPDEIAQTEAPSPGAPVVLISIDTLRSDRLSLYGYSGGETPALEALQRDAILFERTFAHYPLTFPSHVNIFTGLLPAESGIRGNIGYRLEPGFAPYLPSLLREAGYATGATISSHALRSELGLAQGFDYYDEDVVHREQERWWWPERAGSRTLEVAQSWLDRVDEGPFFLFFHLYEPHTPYRPPEPFLSRLGETYEAEIAAADAVVGNLIEDLKRRGLYDRSLIILLSDHGEGLLEHGEISHGILLYREALQVPLLIKLPFSRHRGERVETTAQLIDILPTITDVLGLPAPKEGRGVSLIDFLRSEPQEREVFAETLYPRLKFGWSELSSLLLGRYHFIDAPAPELYDLQDDPGETHNLLAEERRIAADMKQHLASFQTPFEGPTAEEDNETLRMMESLGYLTKRSTTHDADSLLDPKSQIALHERLYGEALALILKGDHVGAIPKLVDMLDANALMSDVWQHLGDCYRATGQAREALGAFEKAIELSRGSQWSLFSAGQVLAQMGRVPEAREHADLIEEQRPELAHDLRMQIALAAGNAGEAARLALDDQAQDTGMETRRRVALFLSAAGQHAQAVLVLERLREEDDGVPILHALAVALAEAGRLQEALEPLQELERKAPGFPLAWETRGLVALRQGRFGEASSHLEHAIELHEELPNSWNLLGVARFQLGDVPGSLIAWQRAVELDPGLLDALYNLGLTAADNGRHDIARKALESYFELASPERHARERKLIRETLIRIGGY